MGGEEADKDRTAFDRTLKVSVALAFFILTLAKYQKRAPYGKFGGKTPNTIDLDPKFGWWLMELPATVSFLCNYYWGHQRRAKEMAENKDQESGGPSGWTPKILFLLWVIHYANRGWYFPLTLRVAPNSKQSFALFNAVIGMVFLSAHGYLNGRMFSELGKHFTNKWLMDVRFWMGLVMYEAGFWITVHSEHVIKNLRPLVPVPGADRYRIPMGGMFTYVTNASYFGELLAWTGMLVLTWSPTLLPVVFISLGNLVPRAFEQHKWYLKQFPNYPKDRKVLIPFII